MSFGDGWTSLMVQTVKCLPAVRWPRLNPWVGKVSWRRKWQPTPVPLSEKSHGRRSLVGYSPWDHQELDTTERLHFHFHFGEGYTLYSLLFSCQWQFWCVWLAFKCEFSGELSLHQASLTCSVRVRSSRCRLLLTASWAKCFTLLSDLF